jgi:hypothetical protein
MRARIGERQAAAVLVPPPSPLEPPLGVPDVVVDGVLVDEPPSPDEPLDPEDPPSLDGLLLPLGEE